MSAPGIRAALVAAMAVAMSLPVGVTPVAYAAGPPGAPAVPRQRVSEVRAMDATGAKKSREHAAASRARDDASAGRAARERAATRWPDAGAAQVPAGAAGVTVGGLPVTLAPKAGAAPGPARVQVLGRAATEAAGVDGVLLTVSAPAPGQADLSVGYASFASTYGGGWSGRLRLALLPACALTTPELAECRTRTPLDSVNAYTAQTLSAPVTLGASPAVLAVAADAAGVGGEAPDGSGNFAATPLAASSTWEAGGGAGSFTWSYPMTPVEPAAGPAPSLDLSYDSGGVDGHTATSNNQGTSVGEGFDLAATSYIDRQYASCDEDGHDKQYDECWKYDNASLVLDGRSSELVKDDTTGRWRLRNDDASTVTRSPGADNGDDDGEYWTVVTGDGTKYVFGLNKLSGAGTQRTNSVWTVPVYGDDSGEPGYTKGDAFADRAVTQAWRWNLDYVEDTHGNAMSYWYTPETNYYRKNKSDTASAVYTRGGHLDKILYGQRSDTLFTADAPDRVTFSYSERCTAADCSSLTKATAQNWPDVPFDSICSKDEAKADCLPEGPAFFSRERLVKIESSVLSGTAYKPVDSWAFTQKYLDGGDIGNSSDQTLTLVSIVRTGSTAGSGAPLPLDPVSFTYLTRPNRVAGGTQPGGGNILPLTRPRVETVTSETGAITTVSYNEPECVRGSQMPKAEDDNASLSCYPQFWHVNGATDASVDWFNKYRVIAVNTADPAGDNPPAEYSYDYQKPAWHYDDSPFTPADERTWSTWRGYQQVTTYTGALGETRGKSVSVYMQGMNGDRLLKAGSPRTVDPDRRRAVSVPGTDLTGLDVPDLTDAGQYAGVPREVITYDGSAPVDVTVDDPWSARTATQHKSYADTEAYYVRTGRTSRHTYLTVPKTWRTTTTSTTYDGYGMAVRQDATGDTAKSGDETCTRTWYARDDGKGITSLVSRTREVGRACSVSEAGLSLPADGTAPGDVLSDVATVYDNAAATGWSASQKPTKGEESWTGRATGYPAAVTGDDRPPTGWQRTDKTTFDTLGRPLVVTDAGGHPTTTAYTPAGAGVPAKTVVTNVKQQKVTTFLDGTRGLPVRTYDPGDAKTEQTYDGLGRLTGVWLPDRSKDGGQSASLTYSYVFQRGKAPSIGTGTVKSSTTATWSYQIFDSLLRPMQTQAPTPNGGRLLSDTRYDARGLAYETYTDIFDSKQTPNAVYTREEYGQAPKQTSVVFDGAGRQTTSTFSTFGVRKWSTTATYTGDSTATTAVTGGKASRTITDALGRTVESREYNSPSPADTGYGSQSSSGYVSTAFTYTPGGDQRAVTGPDGAVWSYTYDLFGRRTGITDPDKGASTVKYDALDQTDTVTGANGSVLLYGYDDLGRKTGLWSGARTDAGKLAAWTYDTVAPGQLTSATSYDGGVAGKAYTRKVLAYDPQYRATSTEIDIAPDDPLVTSGAVKSSYTFGSDYNLDGTLKNSTQPAAGGLAGETVGLTYTPTGQVAGITGTSDYLQTASYDALGQAQQFTLGLSGATDAKKTYINNTFEEGTDRLTRSFVTMPQSAPVKPQDLTYHYDDAGNVTEIADTPTQDGGGGTDFQCFGYDGQRRLTEAWTPATDDCTGTTLGGAAPYRTGYTYTSAGLRATETRYNGSTATTSTYCYGDAAKRHALTAVTAGSCATAPATYSYDKSGNTHTRDGQVLTWDAQGRIATLTQGARTTAYLYDADGSLLIRRAVGDGESVLYLGATEIHSKKTGSAVTTWGTRFYAADSQVLAVRTTQGGTNKVSFLAGDAHGTSSLAVEASGQAVSKRYTTPFGGPRGTATGGGWPDDKGFLGKPADPDTGLTYVGARMYDPVIGRFLSVDPVLSTDQSQSLNGYSYGNDNPATFSDPTGEEIGSKPNSCQYDLKYCTKKVQEDVGYDPKTGRATPPKHKKPRPRPSPTPNRAPKPPPGGCFCHGTGKVNLLTALLWHPFHWGNNANGANALALTFTVLPGFGHMGCERHSRQYVCYGGSPGLDQPMTVGDVLFYPYSKKDYQQRLHDEKQRRDDIAQVAGREVADEFGPDLERHEAVHSRQWANSVSATDFIARYTTAAGVSKRKYGNSAAANKFEVDANLFWGDYTQWAPVHFGPIP
ncbi:RHS repeat domain-containing protein [Sphaerisporangium corydalis]|uniref:RHS repeat domain-containing protein n=1 Tax=Sphaerisporangium corydalis TaxID=1441875 RepID=A0ABV9EN12_9ACTN|nr:RHS repeat-associated core domain-containing protein [Sphaerisporangium corydalis]